MAGPTSALAALRAFSRVSPLPANQPTLAHMTGRILQFGTSRFLQAHVDLFVHEARETGQQVGPISVVKTTRDPSRDGRVAALARPEGYPVVIRGRADGQDVDRRVQVKSVDQAVSAHRDWPAVCDLFTAKADIVVSNVGDDGYAIAEVDRRRPAPEEVPAGFPAKLLSLLLRRHAAGGKPMLLLPCELISGNGRVLRGLLEGLAADWRVPARFLSWLAADVTICDTLVDRIVSAALEPAGAVAEPYALWAIQRRPGFVPPLTHPCIVVTDDLEPYARLKLHILNLGHTYLAEIWRRSGRPADETVGTILQDPAIKGQLETLYRDEIVPGFAARAMADAARAYVVSTVERFENPFLDHPLRDIAQNHAIKIARRADAFIAWVRERDPGLALPRLTALAASQR